MSRQEWLDVTVVLLGMVVAVFVGIWLQEARLPVGFIAAGMLLFGRVLALVVPMVYPSEEVTKAQDITVLAAGKVRIVRLPLETTAYDVYQQHYAGRFPVNVSDLAEMWGEGNQGRPLHYLDRCGHRFYKVIMESGGTKPLVGPTGAATDMVEFIWKNRWDRFEFERSRKFPAGTLFVVRDAPLVVSDAA